MTACGDPAHADWNAELVGKLPADYLNAGPIEGRVCACGGMVWADPADPRPGVELHNATVCHQAWVEIEQERANWGEE